MVLKKIIKNAKHLFFNRCLSEKYSYIYFYKNVFVFFKASEYVMKGQGSDYGAVIILIGCVSIVKVQQEYLHNQDVSCIRLLS